MMPPAGCHPIKGNKKKLRANTAKRVRFVLICFEEKLKKNLLGAFGARTR